MLPSNFKFSGRGGDPLMLPPPPPVLGYAQVSVKYLPTFFKRWWLLATYFSNIAPLPLLTTLVHGVKEFITQNVELAIAEVVLDL
jgi:hypothetical protein